MNFLAPFFLWLIPLVSIPIIIYLFNRNKSRKVNFSSLMFLKFIEQDSIKKLNFLNILLLLIRMVIILLIIMILSRPIYNTNPAWSNNSNDVAIIVIDDSFSMKSELLSPELLKIIKDITKSFDENTLIEIKSLNSNYHFHNTINSQLIYKNINPAYNYDSVDFSFLNNNLNNSSYDNYLNKYLFFITDLQSNQTINKIPDTANNWNINFINYSKPDNNASIANVQLDNTNIIANEKFKISAEIINQSSNFQKDREVSLFIDDIKVASTLIDLNPNKSTTVNLTTSVADNRQYKCYLMINDDYINDDNVFYFTLNLKNDIEIVVIDNTNNKFLIESLNVINYRNNYKINTFSNISDFIESQSKPSVIYIVGFQNFSNQLIKKINNTKLVIFPTKSDYNLNDISDIINLDTKNNRIKFDSDNYLNIDQNINSDILKIFKNVNQNINIKNYISMKSNYNTLISLSNNDFLLNSYKLENNNIFFLFSTDLDLSSSNLPLKGVFIPLINYFIGNDEVLEFVRIGSENNYNFNLSNMKILTPSNKEYNYNVSKSEKSFKFTELGFYQFINNNKYIASNINYDEFSNEEASTFLTKKGVNTINDYDNIYDIINSQKKGFELWRYILFILIFLFLIEFFLSNFYIKNE